ncbi:MAG: CDP-alcohol phosphatidyltransferase family protein [Acidobacteriota bacterium]|nr:CDP-alcohol phosphatidyltransferase family protein [Acidobacteriota bacterium]
MISANQLTILRMVFVPIFVFLVLERHWGGALAVFVLAGITDLLDGFIARKFGQKTPIGTFLDPAADKLLLIASFVLLTQNSVGLTSPIPLWLTITVIGRDVLLVISVVIINLTLGRHLFAPSMYGKATTAIQLLTVFMVLVVNWLGVVLSWTSYVFYLAFILTVVSGMHYLAQGMRLVSGGQNQD